jgi:hypothetical protein
MVSCIEKNAMIYPQRFMLPIQLGTRQHLAVDYNGRLAHFLYLNLLGSGNSTKMAV